jgi:uncharacterized protein (TIGR03067 family)
MRRIATWAMAIGLLGGPAIRGDEPKPAVEADLARLQGTWQLVSAVTNGEKAPEDRVGLVRVIIRGTQHTVMIGDQEVAHNVGFTIDPTTSPKSATDTLEDGRVIRSIYKLDGDTLTNCAGPIDGDRPTEFIAPAESGRTVRVFRRVIDPEVAAELKKFEGTWRYESSLIDGQPVPDGVLETTRLVLKGDTFELRDPMATYRGTFTIDPKARPKTIDIVMTEGPEKGTVMKGIYELAGDTYRLCAGLAGPERPMEFACESGSRRMLHVLKRVDP